MTTKTTRRFADLAYHDPAAATLILWHALQRLKEPLVITQEQISAFEAINVAPLVTIEAAIGEDDVYETLTLQAHSPQASG